MFGICFFMLKPPPQLFRSNVLATSPGESKPKSCLIACVRGIGADSVTFIQHENRYMSLVILRP